MERARVHRAHALLAPIVRLWRAVAHAAPVARAVRRRRVAARVARYAQHWRRMASRRAVWRLAHEPLSEGAGRRRREAPRRPVDLLRSSFDTGGVNQVTAAEIAAAAASAAASVAAGGMGIGREAPTAPPTMGMPVTPPRGWRTSLDMGSLVGAGLSRIQSRLVTAAEEQAAATAMLAASTVRAAPVAEAPDLKVLGRLLAGDEKGWPQDAAEVQTVLEQIRDLRRVVEGSLASP